jgi:hypothetical protein
VTDCFTPIDVASMTSDELSKSVDALMFLGEKHDKSIKGNKVAKGQAQLQHWKALC